MHLELTWCKIVAYFSSIILIRVGWSSELVIRQWSPSHMDSVTWHVCHEDRLSLWKTENTQTKLKLHNIARITLFQCVKNFTVAVVHMFLAQIQHWRCRWAPIMAIGSGGGVLLCKSSSSTWMQSNRLAGAAPISNTDIRYKSRVG